MRLLSLGASVMFAAPLLAGDTVTLRDGRVVAGDHLGGSAREVRIETGDGIQTVKVADIIRARERRPYLVVRLRS